MITIDEIVTSQLTYRQALQELNDRNTELKRLLDEANKRLKEYAETPTPKPKKRK